MHRIKIPVGVKILAVIWLLALCVPTVRQLPGTRGFYQLAGAETPAPEAIADDLARRFPDNSTALAWRAETAYLAGDKGALQAVAARFPADISLRALQVRAFPDGETSIEAARNKAGEAERARWIEAAQIARAGGQAEPDNAFWPWMEAAFEFGARHDNDALRAFERAGNCTRYENYALANARARNGLWEAARAPSWQQKISLWSFTAYSQLTPMRDATKLATARARSLLAQGDDARALGIEAGLLNAARLACRDDPTINGTLLAENVGQTSLKEFFDIARPNGPWSSAANNPDAVHKARLARAWADFARENGRPELAGRADFLTRPSVGVLFQRADDTPGGVFAVQLGLPAPWLSVALIAPFVLIALALCIAAGALIWLAGAPLRFEGALPTRGQAVACANFSFWLLVGLAALFFVRSPDGIFNFVLGSPHWNSGDVLLGLCALVAGCWLLPVGLIGWGRRRQEASSAVAMAGKKLPFGIVNPAVPALWMAAFGFGIGLFNSVAWSGSNRDSATFALCALVSALGALLMSWRVTRQQFGWQLARRSAGVLVVMGSALFLLFAVGVWPLNAQLNRHLERTLQIGEIAAMREQIARVK